MQSERSNRAKLLAVALASFGKVGFEATSFEGIAKAAEVPPAEALLLFPTKHALLIAIYQGLVADTQSVVADLEPGDLGQRYAALLEAKLDRLDAQRPAMRALLAAAIDARGPAGVLSPTTAAIRARMSGAVLTAVVGADNAPADPAPLSALLYGLHLGIVLLWTQDDDGRMARGVVALCRELLGRVGPLFSLPAVGEMLPRVGAIFGDRLAPVVSADVEARSRWILARLLRGRRLQGDDDGSAPAEVELAPHLPLVRTALSHGRPLELLLPAFPAKSPNPRKVLGKLPDYAEHAALRSLQTLCEELSEAHSPGVRLILCSDGLVFADAVGVADEDVTAYGAQIDTILKELPLLQRFDLADAFGATSPEDARRRLLSSFAETTDDLRKLAASSRALGAQLDGLHRFLFEDAVALSAESSRTRLRNEARVRAVEVLRRSRAWGNLLSSLFPEALRLSIHPQPRISDKIGIHLVSTADAWLTPWHGVALIENERVRLVKRADAEAAGAHAVDVEGPLARFVLGDP